MRSKLRWICLSWIWKPPLAFPLVLCDNGAIRNGAETLVSKTVTPYACGRLDG
jgi:hypothetical protein